MIGKSVVEILDMTELIGDGQVVIDNVVEQQQQRYMKYGKVFTAILLTDDQWESVVEATAKTFAREGLDPPNADPKDSLFGTPVWRVR